MHPARPSTQASPPGPPTVALVQQLGGGGLAVRDQPLRQVSTEDAVSAGGVDAFQHALVVPQVLCRVVLWMERGIRGAGTE